jgi:hypothetical protein
MSLNKKSVTSVVPSIPIRALFAGGIIIILAFFSLMSCKNATGPDFYEVNVVAYNYSGIAVDIYVDGGYRISIEVDTDGTITGVSNGSHLFEVKEKGGELLITSLQFDVTENNEYTWVIDGPASIKITNNYGETLSIYSGDEYMGDLGSGETRSITNVPFGEHNLTAVKVSDSVTLATVTITITEVKEYIWVITV